METLKGTVNKLIIFSLLIVSAAAGNAQDYYGGGNGGGGSWRRQPPPNNQQPKDKDKGPDEPSGFLSINFGFANAIGNYGQPYSQNTFNQSTAFGEGYGNYALQGDIFHFSLGIPVNHSNFGFALMFGSSSNEYDMNSYVNNLTNEPSIGNPYSSSLITGYANGSGANEYASTSIMGGLFATYPIGRLSIDGRLMIGVLLSTLPEQDFYAEDAAGDILEYDIQPSNATSLAFDAGVGARFMIAELGRRKLCAMVNVDIMYSNVSYNTQQYLYVTPSTGTNAGYEEQLVPSPTITGSLPIQLLNVTFGIGYQL